MTTRATEFASQIEFLPPAAVFDKLEYCTLERGIHNRRWTSLSTWMFAACNDGFYTGDCIHCDGSWHLHSWSCQPFWHSIRIHTFFFHILFISSDVNIWRKEYILRSTAHRNGWNLLIPPILLFTCILIEKKIPRKHFLTYHTNAFTKENHRTTKLSMSVKDPQLLNPNQKSTYSVLSVLITSAPIIQPIRQCNQTFVLLNPNISGSSIIQKESWLQLELLRSLLRYADLESEICEHLLVPNPHIHTSRLWIWATLIPGLSASSFQITSEPPDPTCSSNS